MNMKKILREIRCIKIDFSRSLQDLHDEFCRVMENNGVRYSTKSGSSAGHTCANPEWVLFHDYFLNRFPVILRMHCLTDDRLFEEPFVEYIDESIE